jgi:poly(3-hydroxybutyrate) depolymerase
MYYQLYELNHAALQPFRALADSVRLYYSNPLNPLAHTMFGRSIAAGAELFERTTRRYGKPSFGLEETKVDFQTVPVVERVIWSKPFCDLIHFDRAIDPERKPDPKILIVAPMSGHYATLLRGTVETLLPHAEIYITDWADARMVPLADGRFVVTWQSFDPADGAAPASAPASTMPTEVLSATISSSIRRHRVINTTLRPQRLPMAASW